MGGPDVPEPGILQVRWGFAFVTIIILFSVVFEYGCELLKESLPEQEEVISCLLEELTTLGFLGEQLPSFWSGFFGGKGGLGIYILGIPSICNLALAPEHLG